MVNEILNLLVLYLLIIILPAYFIIDWVNYYISSTKSSIVLSLGVAPLLMSGMLYFMLLLLPNQSVFIYFTIGFGFLLAFKFFIKKYHQITLKPLQTNLSFSKTEKTITIILFLLFLLSVVYSAWRPLSEHDTFEYMFLGKQLAFKKQLLISNYRYDENSGSYFVGMHGLLYPLLYAWQVLINQIMQVDSEWWFKSLSGFYTILFIAMFSSYLKIINHRLMVFGLCLLLTTYAMLFSMLQFHLEMIRLFLFVAVLYISISFIKVPKNQLGMLGLVLGLQAGIHFIGLVISALVFVLVFFFMQQSSIQRTKILGMQFIIFLCTGALHYLLEYLLGDGYWWQKITGN